MYYICIMKRTLIITAITGGKDKLIDPEIVFDNCDYYAFVDEIDKNIQIWIQIESYNFSNLVHPTRRNAKVEKILLSESYLNDYDYVIWHDGTHQLAVNPDFIYNKYGDFDILCFRHAQRRCLYQELKAIDKMDSPYLIEEQTEYYRVVGMPEYYGLYEMGCYIRKTNLKMMNFGLAWFEQICKFSSRDQVSFPFVLWKMEKEIKLKIMEGNCSSYIGTPFQNEGNKYFTNHSNHIK